MRDLDRGRSTEHFLSLGSEQELTPVNRLEGYLARLALIKVAEWMGPSLRIGENRCDATMTLLIRVEKSMAKPPILAPSFWCNPGFIRYIEDLVLAAWWGSPTLWGS